MTSRFQAVFVRIVGFRRRRRERDVSDGREDVTAASAGAAPCKRVEDRMLWWPVMKGAIAVGILVACYAPAPQAGGRRTSPQISPAELGEAISLATFHEVPIETIQLPRQPYFIQLAGPVGQAARDLAKAVEDGRPMTRDAVDPLDAGTLWIAAEPIKDMPGGKGPDPLASIVLEIDAGLGGPPVEMQHTWMDRATVVWPFVGDDGRQIRSGYVHIRIPIAQIPSGSWTVVVTAEHGGRWRFPIPDAVRDRVR